MTEANEALEENYRQLRLKEMAFSFLHSAIKILIRGGITGSVIMKVVQRVIEHEEQGA